MNRLTLMLLLAAPTLSPADENALDPFSFLAGHCWTGTHPGGATTDTHCYSWVYGRSFLRDVHVVEGEGEPYCGETLYHVDPEDGTVRFTYYNSLGGVSRGRMEAREEGLFSPAEEYAGAGGSKVLLRSWLIPADDHATYRVTTDRERDGEWQQVTDTGFAKAPGLSPDTALAGACEDTGDAG